MSIATSNRGINKIAKLCSITLFTILIAACSKNNAETAKETKSSTPPPAPTTAAQPAMPTMPTAEDITKGNPDDVLVNVNGTKLTRADVAKEVDAQLEAYQGRIPPGRMSEARQNLYKYAVGQFVVKTLLLDEAKKENIKITKADKDKAYEKIKENLPEGKTLEQAFAEAPMGKEKVEEEIIDGLTITKLIEKEMSNKVSVTDEEVAAFKKEHADDLKIPEKVRASHILIGFDDNDTDKTKAEKKAKAEKIRKELLNGGDFAKLAMENSSCPSKAKGGDLGAFGRGQMVPAFEEAAFSQKVGEIGPVVETKFGYHIIKVTEHDKGGTISDEKIKNMLETQKQREVANDLISKLRENAKITYAKGFEPEAMMPQQ